jgi:hypothetical protein
METIMQIRATEKPEEFGKCGCGRSPTGKCIGWHGLSEDAFRHAQMLWMEEELRRDADLEEYQKQAQDLWSDGCTTPRSTK